MQARKQHLTSVTVIIVMMLSAGCLSLESSHELEISLVSDKDTYSFAEAMLVQVIIDTSQSMDNVTIEGEGLISIKNGIPRANLRFGPRTVDLLPGTNIINFTERVPSCSPCTNLTAGSYNITASVTYEGAIIANMSRSIYLTE